jgi:hypothetical protein
VRLDQPAQPEQLVRVVQPEKLVQLEEKELLVLLGPLVRLAQLVHIVAILEKGDQLDKLVLEILV